MSSNRVVALHPFTQAPQGALRLRWCDIRLGRNARLAGIKHLNRLEQVLAQSEWREGEVDEGLMLDTEGEVVCATSANVFVVRDGALVDAGSALLWRAGRDACSGAQGRARS